MTHKDLVQSPAQKKNKTKNFMPEQQISIEKQLLKKYSYGLQKEQKIF